MEYKSLSKKPKTGKTTEDLPWHSFLSLKFIPTYTIIPPFLEILKGYSM